MSQKIFEKVSVIVPAYNSAATLGRCLDSLLKQTLPVYEILVVDDGSTDSTKDIVKKYATVTYIKHAKNKGASAARNTGIEAATGDYIAFLDDDDTWRPDKLAIQLKEMQRNQADASCGSFVIHRGGGEKTYILKNPDDWKPFILNGCTISPGATLLVKKSIFTQVGLFDTNLPRLEDWAWLIDFVFKGYKMHLCGDILADVYTTGYPCQESVLKSLAILKAKVGIKHHLTLAEKRRFSSACNWESAAVYKRSGQSIKMVFCLINSFVQHPAAFLQRLGL